MQPTIRDHARRGVVYLWLLVLTLGAGLSSCTCSKSSGGGTIPCATDPECPAPLTCDEPNGYCVDPFAGDGGAPFQCAPVPLPGCECVDGMPMIDCLQPGGDPSIIASCMHGRSACDPATGFYGACMAAPDPNCEAVSVAAGGFDLTPENSDQVTTGPEGELILDPDVNEVSFGYLWIANTGENTVSKLDIDTGREVARYAAVRESNGLGVPAVPLGGYNGDQSNCGNCPSRTAIDYNGDAFVANRAFGEQATITKYANTFEGCLDYDGNGVIDTSVDVDGDGRIDVTDPGEFLGEADECILWTKPVGDNDGVARAMAIDAGGPDGENGNVWVGLWNERRVVQISGDTGDPVIGPGGVAVSVPLQDAVGSLRPYGAAVDGGGNIWVTGIEEGDLVYLAKVNAYTATLTALYPVPDDDDGCAKSYGITIDIAQRVWIAGWECQDLKAFEPSTQIWSRVDPDVSNTRGIATDVDGNVWIAYTDAQVAKFKMSDIVTLGNAATPLAVYDIPPLPAPNDQPPTSTIGVGIDRNGACWAVSRNDDSEIGAATRIAADGTVQSFPVGKRPYTYSDFTGFGLLTVVRPNGFWRGNVAGCAAPNTPSDWQTLDWGENEPPGTAVRMRLRVADTIVGLDAAAWYGPWDAPVIDLDAEGVPTTMYMQVEVQLSTTDIMVSPSFSGFTVAFDCPDIDPVP